MSSRKQNDTLGLFPRVFLYFYPYVQKYEVQNLIYFLKSFTDYEMHDWNGRFVNYL